MFRSLFLTAMAVTVVTVCLSQVPQTLSYQGFLTDETGQYLEGPQNVNFKFYTTLTGGTAISGSTRGPINVETFKGLFTTTIGDGSTNNAALDFALGDGPLFVEIILGNNPDGNALVPRVEITAVPYAFVANSVKSVDPSVLISPVPLDKGGTGATNASNARTTLGLAIGTDVQAFDTDLADLADGTLSGSKVGSGISASNITTGSLSLSGTDAVKLPSGTTAQRPVSGVEGQIRYNSDEKVLEYYNGTNWYFVSPKVIILKDEETGNFGAGGGISNDWQSRGFTNYYGDESVLSGGFTVGNTFDLSAGEYIIEASAPAFRAFAHQIRLNINGGDILAYGSSEYAPDQTGGSITRSKLVHRFTLNQSQSLQLMHYVNGNAGGDGNFGFSTPDPGNTDVFIQAKITRLR